MRYAQFNRHEGQKCVSGSMKNALVFSGMVMLLALTNCAGSFSYSAKTEYMTREVRNTFSIEELKGITYYIDEDVVLYRELNTGEAPAISGGAVVMRNGKRVERIRIDRSTPGVLVETKNVQFSDGVQECFGICFESSDDDLDKFLLFRPGILSSSINKPDGYYLMWYTVSGQPSVLYGDKYYNMEVNGIQLYMGTTVTTWPYLKGVIKSTNTEVRQERKAGGRRVQ